MDHSLPADSRRTATLPVPTGTSSFELGMLVVELLVREYGAEVVGYDASPEGASVELRLPRRNL
jgi:hypothetical protein